MKTVCASCTALDYENPILSSKNKKPLWLDKIDYVSKFIENHSSFSIYKPSKYDQKIELNLGKSQAGKKILYWGASPNHSLHIKGAKDAYNEFENRGVSKIDSDGKVKVYLQCPQPYKTTKKGSRKEETFYRHFHFVFSNKCGDKWSTQLRTQIMICERDYKQLIGELDSGTSVIINALPSQYYAQDHIPNSYNLFHDTVKHMPYKETIDWFTYVVKQHYPVIYKQIQMNSLKIEEVPIICYCAHKDCDAAYKTVIELLKKGFVRVDEYKGGMKEYNYKTRSRT